MERTYTIPLREAWMNKPNYKRSKAAVQEVKRFIARHMKVPDHDVDKVKIDVYLNNEMRFRGSRHPPASIKVTAKNVNGLIHVELSEPPAHIAFEKAKHERRHRKAEKKTPVKEAKPEEKTEDEKKAETEKEQSAAIVKEQLATKEAKVQKQISKKQEPKINRMALKK